MGVVTGPGSTAETPFRATRALAWLSGFAALGLGLSAVYATTGYGLGCPFRTLTGWDCPFCGGTRLGSALLQGDVATAFGLNPLVFVGLVVLTGLGLVWLLEAVGGPRVRLPQRVAAAIRRPTPTGWLMISGVVAAAYTLFRNLL